VPRIPTRSNAPGDFYVAAGECVTCGAPGAEAPDLIGLDEEVRSCFFKRQPATPEELADAISAVRVACCGALRYGGSDPHVQRELVTAGCAASIDVPLRRLTRTRTR